MRMLDLVAHGAPCPGPFHLLLIFGLPGMESSKAGFVLLLSPLDAGGADSAF